jgi:hypothetical protein
MTAILTPIILSSISNDICNGRPVWGLFRANEYLEKNSPIRKALVSKALSSKTANQSRLKESDSLIELASSGSKLSELNPAERKEVMQLNEVATMQRRRVAVTSKMNSRCFTRRTLALPNTIRTREIAASQRVITAFPRDRNVHG